MTAVFIPGIWWYQEFLSNWRLFVACYYPTTTTNYPSTSIDTFVGPPVAVNIDICEYLQFLSTTLLWHIWGTLRHWQPFRSPKNFCFIGQCWYFNPQRTPERALIKAGGGHRGEMRFYKVKAYILSYVKGFRSWRGYNLCPVWKPDLHGSYSIENHS